MVKCEGVRNSWGNTPVNRVFIVGFTPPAFGWNKQLVDSRPRPKWMVELAACVRTAFLVSNNLRRNTRLYFVGRSSDTSEFTVLLEGSKLRYIEPSERNTLLLLGRAFEFTETTKYPRQSTPGITWLPIGIKEITQLESLTKHWLVTSVPGVSSENTIAIVSRQITPSDRLGILLTLDDSVQNSFEQVFTLSSETIDSTRINISKIRGSMIILISHFELDRRDIP